MADQDTGNDIETLQRLITICRRNGLQEYEGLGFKLKFQPTAVKPRTKKEATPDITNQPPQFTPEQILMWSAGGGFEDMTSGD